MRGYIQTTTTAVLQLGTGVRFPSCGIQQGIDHQEGDPFLMNPSLQLLNERHQPRLVRRLHQVERAQLTVEHRNAQRPLRMALQQRALLPAALAAVVQLELAEEQPVVFASNTLVIAVPADSGIESLEDLDRLLAVVVAAAGLAVAAGMLAHRRVAEHSQRLPAVQTKVRRQPARIIVESR